MNEIELAERREAQRAKRREYDRTYKQRHPDRWAESNRKAVAKWRGSNLSEAQRRDREYARKWRLTAAPHIIKAYSLAHCIKKHGMSLEQYDQMLAAQGGVCATCKKVFPGRGPHIDHDHASGKVRGLLCNACNSMIGFAKDSESTLLAAVEYLRCHKSTPVSVTTRHFLP